MSVFPELENLAFALFRKLWIRNGLPDCTDDYPAVPDSACPDDFCEAAYAFQRLSASLYQELCEKSYEKYARSRSDFFFFLNSLMDYFRRHELALEATTLSLAAMIAEMGVTCARRSNRIYVLSSPLAFAMVLEEEFFAGDDDPAVWEALLNAGSMFRHVPLIADIVGRSESLRRDLTYRLLLLRFELRTPPDDLHEWLRKAAMYGGGYDKTDLDNGILSSMYFPMCLEILHEEYLVYLKPLYAENFNLRSDFFRKNILRGLAEMCEIQEDSKEAFCTLYEASLFGKLAETPPQPAVTRYLSLLHESHDLDQKSMVASEIQRDDLYPGLRKARITKEDAGILSEAPSLNELYDLKPKDTESLHQDDDRGQETQDTKYKLEEHSEIICTVPILKVVDGNEKQWDVDCQSSVFDTFAEEYLKLEKTSFGDSDTIKLKGSRVIDKNCSQMDEIFKTPVSCKPFSLQIKDTRTFKPPMEDFSENESSSETSSISSADSICTVVSVETNRSKIAMNTDNFFQLETKSPSESPRESVNLPSKLPETKANSQEVEESPQEWESLRKEVNESRESNAEEFNSEHTDNKNDYCECQSGQIPSSPKTYKKDEILVSREKTDSDSMQKKANSPQLQKAHTNDEELKTSMTGGALMEGMAGTITEDEDKSERESKKRKNRPKKKNKQDTGKETEGPNYEGNGPEQSESIESNVYQLILVMGVPFEKPMKRSDRFMDRIYR